MKRYMYWVSHTSIWSMGPNSFSVGWLRHLKCSDVRLTAHGVTSLGTPNTSRTGECLVLHDTPSSEVINTLQLSWFSILNHICNYMVIFQSKDEYGWENVLYNIQMTKIFNITFKNFTYSWNLKYYCLSIWCKMEL